MTATLIHADREPWNDAVAIRVAQRRPGSRRIAIAQPVAFVEQDEGEFSGPMIRLETTDAQRLMDELWNCGLRPSEGTGSAGSLRATERHLADMQLIAFSLLDRHAAPTP